MMTAELRLLRDLVALPSVNPAFLPPNDPCGGERSVAEFLAAVAGRAGLEVELREIEPGRPNISAILRAKGPCRQRILLAPHLDTVGVDGEARFQPKLSGGRLHGRGACDTKGSVAAMLSAVLRLAKRRRRPSETEVVFVGLIDEENRQAGSRALAASGFEADLAIVGEPTRLRVVTAHKGNLWLQLETQGKAAHGSTPERGCNAILSMSRVVEVLEGAYATGLKDRKHALLGSPSVNVGTIRGGAQPNIVPDRCVISVDRRTLPGESDAGVRRELRSLLKKSGLQARLLPLREVPCPALETSPKLSLVGKLMQAAACRRPVGVDYFCDAAVLAGGGIPSVVFGPGDIAQAHTRDEWIAVNQLQQATAILETFLGNLP